MGVHNALDVPGGVRFFHGHGPAPVLGPCPHDCEHRHLSVIAWGPDWQRYELIQCDMVCDGQCRGWKIVEHWQDRGRIERWMQVDLDQHRPLHDPVERLIVPPITGSTYRPGSRSLSVTPRGTVPG